MKDKEKQLQEIEDILNDAYMTISSNLNVLIKVSKLGFNRVYAEALYNAGYSKVTDGAVVLTSREYQSLRESLSETTNRECELSDRARELLHENDELKAKNEKLLESIENLTSGKCATRCPLVEQVRKETAREILSKLKVMLIERFDYFGELRNKNLKADNNDNVLFDLGQMDCINCILDKIKELVKKYSVEVEE